MLVGDMDHLLSVCKSNRYISEHQKIHLKVVFLDPQHCQEFLKHFSLPVQTRSLKATNFSNCITRTLLNNSRIEMLSDCALEMGLGLVYLSVAQLCMASSSLYVSIFSACCVSFRTGMLSSLLSSLPKTSHCSSALWWWVGISGRAWHCVTEPPIHQAFRSCPAQVKDAHIGLSLIKALSGKELGDSAASHLSCL